MDKKIDQQDDRLFKLYQQIRGELISTKKDCPPEDRLWKYGQGKLAKKEREQIDGHLLVCSNCLESLQVIRMILKAQESLVKVPVRLHEKALALLNSALAKSDCPAKPKPLIAKLTLLWDQALNSLTQLSSDLGEMIIPQVEPEVQPIRKSIKESGETKEHLLSLLPFRKNLNLPGGQIFLQIEPSKKEDSLTMRLVFHSRLVTMPGKEVSNLRLILHKSGKMCSSIYLDPESREAAFDRIKAGEYSLELIQGEKSLGIIECMIHAAETK